MSRWQAGDEDAPSRALILAAILAHAHHPHRKVDIREREFKLPWREAGPPNLRYRTGRLPLNMSRWQAGDEDAPSRALILAAILAHAHHPPPGKAGAQGWKVIPPPPGRD